MERHLLDDVLPSEVVGQDDASKTACSSFLAGDRNLHPVWLCPQIQIACRLWSICGPRSRTTDLGNYDAELRFCLLVLRELICSPAVSSPRSASFACAASAVSFSSLLVSSHLNLTNVLGRTPLCIFGLSVGQPGRAVESPSSHSSMW